MKNEVNRALAAKKNEVNRALAAKKNEVNRALAAKKKIFLLMALCLTTVFAAKAADKIYAVWDEPSTTLTLRYDDQCEAKGGVTDWSVYKGDATNVVLDVSMKNALPKSTESWFGEFEELTKIQHLDYLNTSEVTDMSGMFYACYLITSLDLSSFNTEKVTNMSYMFNGCNSLSSLDISSFNTEKVTDLSYMFGYCKVLTSLDLSSFKTEKVTDMSGIFGGCKALTTIYWNEDLSERTDFDSYKMFYDCMSLKGEKGTNCDGTNNIDNTYARPDEAPSKPGYFTKKLNKVYTVFVESTGTLTYYCDKNMDSHMAEGTVETYDPVNDPDKIRFEGYSEKVTKAVIHKSMKDTLLTSMRRMFYGTTNRLTKLASIEGLEYLNTSKVTDMSAMFSNCRVLESLNLSTFNTANVTDMGSMFSTCSALKSIQLSSSFNTANVTDMAAMFYQCEKLTSLDLSSFNTPNVTKTLSMFVNCKALKTLDIRSFDLAKAVNTNDVINMFYGCSELTTIYCNNDWSLNTALASTPMFKGCSKLVGGNGTTHQGVNDISYAHPDEAGNLGYFTATPEVYTVFVEATGTLTYYCDKNKKSHMAEGTVETYDPVNNPGKFRFVEYADKVTKVVLHNSMKDTLLTSTRKMFYGGYDLISYNDYCLENLTTIEGLENLNTSNVTDMSGMFESCESLTSLNLSSFNTSNVTDMYGMFESCTALESIQFGASFNTANVTNMNGMFAYCSSLTSLDLSTFSTANVTDMYAMFFQCAALESLNLSSFNTANVTNMYAMFFQCAALESIQFGASFSTANVTNMYAMFFQCYSLKSLDLCSFEVTNVTDMGYMFESCSNLTTIYCNGNWSLNTTVVSDDMFYGCSQLVGGNDTQCDGATNIDISYAHPDEAGNPGYFTKKSTTGIDQTNEEMRKCENEKILRNGQIYILRGEKIYTVTGQEVR